MSESDKLDAPSRHLLATTGGADADGDQPVSAIVRGCDAFTPAQVDDLRAEGVQVRTVAGDVLTATLTRAMLPTLAAHDFVLAVQLSMPLWPEAPEDASQTYDVE